ncbi:hypothetical protein Ccrd_015435 [Cynara cardunculus var. scolymus]|uniref:ABC1 atypical kinase-like domain-containing protein n=1 Tax=Cynara cardunculus var. scolymus TaxID=59895 RepID=A0A103YBU1_CYNCS|nr:hypothetical protein Ccrd_015435 [Cynara cardunculus var. scolymus]
MPSFDLKQLHENLSTHSTPWQRSFQFWARAADIYTGYKVFQVRVSFEKDVQKAEEMWERHHEHAADKIYSMCYDMGGFFLKVAQVVGKPDLAPAAWVRKLVTLCDHAPETPSNVVRLVLEKELGKTVDEMFERFEWDPIGSASIAQVHRARLKGDKKDVVVKVQHPGVQDLMMTDLRNLQTFALCLQKTDLKFDLFSVCKEMEKQVNTNSARIGYEFDFKREADAMERIRSFLSENNRKTVVKVPRVIRGVVTSRRVLVMEYIDGIPILNLKDEIMKRGIDPDGKIAAAAKQELGIDTVNLCENERAELFNLAQVMFDTKLPPGVKMLQPYAEDATLKKIAVQSFPEELFSVLRTVHLLRGLSVGLGLNYSCAEEWRPIAEEALYLSGRLRAEDLKSKNRRKWRFFRR